MRSSKSRSRSKTNRPRTLGNIINRVFDSSGPEGKVRGTPQQIIEKYQMLARDAQLSNDRVAAENFSQHAEHYTRLLAEATREMAAEQEARGQQNGAQGGGQGGGQNTWQNRNPDSRDGGQRYDAGDGDQPYGAALDTIDGEAALVDLPEQDRANAQPRQFPQRQPRQNDGRNNDGRSNDGRGNDGRQNNRPRDDRPRDDRPREERPRDDRPRDDRPRDERPREEKPRDDRRPAPAPQLRFEDGPAEVGPAEAKPAPVFESPAAVVAQVQAAPTPKPRAPRAKRVEKPEAIAPNAPKENDQGSTAAAGENSDT
jgi:hypothetical protein